MSIAKETKQKKRKSVLLALFQVAKQSYKASPFVFVCIVLLILFNGIGGFVSLSFTEYIVNSAYSLVKGTELYADVVKTIFVYLLLMLVFQVVGIVLANLKKKLIVSFNYGFQKEFFSKLSHVNWEYYECHKTSQQIFEARQNANKALLEMLDSIFTYISFVPSIVVYFYYLLQVHIIVIPIYIGLVIIFNVRLAGKMFSQLQEYWKEVQPFAQKQNYYFETTGNQISHQEYRFLRLFDFTTSRWKQCFDKEFAIKIKIFRKHEVTLQIARLLFNIPYILMMIYIGISIFHGELEIGFLIMANTLLNQIIDTCIQFQDNLTQNHVNLEFISVLEQIMNYDEVKPSVDVDLEFNYIKFCQVTYQYPQSEKKALDSFSITFNKGEKIAVVGVNGSGKTTFANIICGLTNRYEGKILSDHKDSPKVSVACVFQNFAQYQMSIYDNIACGDVTHMFTEKEIWDLLLKVGIDGFVRSLPNGIHTVLGQLEGGTELSKGQWQRLAIARLLAKKDAQIWILDEPTAYLDPMSEIEIYELIYRLSENKTVFFISHRLGFAKRADKIVVFDSGHIVEEGTHDSLMAELGIYSKMYETQKNWYSK